MITSGLKHLWPLNETSGSARDVVGGNDGTLNGGVKQNVGGKSGLSAYSFNGSDGYVALSTPSGSNFTVGGWAYFGSAPSKGGDTLPVGAGDNDGNSGEQQLFFHPDRFFFRYSDGGPELDAAAPASVGEWFHAILVVNGPVATFYCNGEVIKSKNDSAINSFDFSTYANFRIASRKMTDNVGTKEEFADGMASSVVFYDRALSPLEVRQLYREGAQALAPADGVSRYELNGDATDSWHANDGTNNGVTFESGYYGQAGSFVASESDYVQIGSTDLLGGLSSATVCGWVKANTIGDGTARRIASNDYTSSWHLLEDTDGNIQAGWYNGGWTHITGPSLSTKTWYFAVTTYDSGSIKLYLDGKLVASGDTGGSTIRDNGEWPAIGAGKDGASSTNAYWDGLIDDVRIYDRALRDWEIKSLFEGYSDLVAPPSDGVAYYKFDDKVASGAIDSFGTNDGTINGATYTTGVRGKALDFADGEDVTATLSQSITDGTLSFWAKRTGTSSDPNPGLVDIGEFSNGTGWGVWLRNDSGQNRLNIHDSGANYKGDLGPELTDDWVHVAVTVSGSNMQMYVNTTPSKEITGATINADADLYIGKRPNGEDIPCVLDDVRIYDYALSPSEVHDIYQWGTLGRDLRGDLL